MLHPLYNAEGETGYASSAPDEPTKAHRSGLLQNRERAKVVNDLLFTGDVAGFLLVDRPVVPRRGQNATGDSLETDGKIAALLLTKL